jgi:hypothetical protein
MIIVNINGGLGNQMFQYALGKALSITNKTELKLYVKEVVDRNDHNGLELENVFNITSGVVTDTERRLVLGARYTHKFIKLLRSKKLNFLRGKYYIVEQSFNYDKNIKNMTENVFLRGFWQSEKYFLDYREEILKEFSFKNKFSDENLKIAKKIQEKSSVAIHVRRGDYISNPGASKTFVSLDVQYYQKAIEKLDIDIPHALLVFFSDDISWVKKNIINRLLSNYEYIIVDNNKGDESYNDMRLMSLCDHNIIANSSFSWWGAWLNQNPRKQIIAPKKWFLIDKNTDDLYPNNWIKI